MIAPQPRLQRLSKLLDTPSRIRNISIVAHVDHGKTTLADNLISSNGIISRKLAGKLKYMDSRIDEQDRGITMKSSAISLIAKVDEEEYLVNLIDSPGHVEFGFEVEAALRLTDGALVVVDVLEGISSQTYRVLMQSFEEKVSTVLVLNKIDKLIREKQMSPLEAYQHLNQLIEQVNALIGSFINLNAQKYAPLKHKSSKQLTEEEIEDKKVGELEHQFYFAVEKNNVIFCSAVDNWGFSTAQFVPLISKKLGVDQKLVQKHLWGDYYYYPKTKTFSTEPKHDNDKPLCVDFVLQTIWEVYEKVFEKNIARVEKIISVLGLKINDKIKQTLDYPLVREILMNWIPLDKAIFRSVVNCLPDPIQAQKFRLSLLYPISTANQDPVIQKIRQAIEMCDNSVDAPMVVFVSKVVQIPRSHFNERGLKELNPGQENKSLGFARIFSGRLKRGQKVFVIGPKSVKTVINGEAVYENDITETTIDNVYLLMGQYPEGIQQIPAGNIFGIGNLENIIFKTGTVSSIKECHSLSPAASHAKAILRVSISTPIMENMGKVVDGLKKLNKSDPSVEVYVERSGDIILSTCGEVHLERCVLDLENIFAKVAIKYSEPIINFRETIVWCNPVEKNNKAIIQELEAKKKEEMKKELRERLKKEAREDVEIDELEKEKLKIIEDWEFGVEKYDAADFTVEDTRFFFKSREDEDKEPEKYEYKREKEFKKTDHKNRNKTKAKEQFLNLSERTNIVTTRTPNELLEVQVKAVGFKFQAAEFLQKSRARMKDLFDSKSEEEQELQKRREFLEELNEVMKEHKVDKHLFQMIQEKLYCFGPNKCGPNMLLINNLNSEHSLFKRCVSPENKDEPEKGATSQLNIPGLQELYKHFNITENQLMSSMYLGFDMATQAGPMCEEPMMGVCFIINSLKHMKKEEPKVEEKKEKSVVEVRIIQENVQETPGDKKEETSDGNLDKQSVEVEQHDPPHSHSSEQPEKKQPPQEHSTEGNISEIQSNSQPKEQNKEQDKVKQPSEQVAEQPTEAPQTNLKHNEEKKEIKEIKETKDSFGPMVGQVISQIKQGCLQSFMGAGPRLVEPVYECNLQTQEDYYGNVHGELSRRRAKILDEDLHESSNLFLIKAQLPVVESFGFCGEMRTKTQGRVNAQLHFDTWKIYEQDPFYIPLSKEEVEESGMESLPPNSAKLLLDKIRKGKGLFGSQKIVAAAEKQRTLKKN